MGIAIIIYTNDTQQMIGPMRAWVLQSSSTQMCLSGSVVTLDVQ